MKRKLTDRQLEVAYRLLSQIAAKEQQDPALWPEGGYRAYALKLLEECVEKIVSVSGETADMTMIMRTIEPPWGKLP